MREKLVPVVDLARRLGREVTLGGDARIVIVATGEDTSAAASRSGRRDYNARRP